MRRKIEKYLARKQGLEEGAIQPEEDGRYDFDDDLDGVLAAVRGSDPESSTKKKMVHPHHLTKSSSQHPHHRHHHPHANMNNNGGNMNMPPYYPPPYNPYGMYPMAPHMMRPNGNGGNANNNSSMPPYATPWANPPPPQMMQHGPPLHALNKPLFGAVKSPDPSPLATLQLSTPRAKSTNTDYADSSCLSTAHKSMFDFNFSPPASKIRQQSSLLSSSEHMTPPMSCLKDIFASPMPAASSPSALTPTDAASLNKSLFADHHSSVLTPFGGTKSSSCLQSPPSAFLPDDDENDQDKPICIHMTSDNHRLSSRVSISPIRSLPLPTASTTDDDKFGFLHSSSAKLSAATPSTVATSSFWSCDFTPEDGSAGGRNPMSASLRHS